MDIGSQFPRAHSRLNGAEQPQGAADYVRCYDGSFAGGDWVDGPNRYARSPPPDISYFQPSPIFRTETGLSHLPPSAGFDTAQSSSQGVLGDPEDAYSSSNSGPLVAGTLLSASGAVAPHGDSLWGFRNGLGVDPSPSSIQFATTHDLRAIPHNVPNVQMPFPPPSMTLHPVGPNGEMKPSIYVPTAPFGNVLQNRFPIASPPVQRISPQRVRRSPRSQPSPSSRRATAINRATSAGQRLYCIVHGCTYTKPFARKADLERHLVTQHEHDLPFQRKQFMCPWACGMGFLRADKMLQHQDRVHQSRKQEYEILVSAPP